jgi:hypothetical protein
MNNPSNLTPFYVLAGIISVIFVLININLKGPQLKIQKAAKESFEKAFDTGRALLVGGAACFGAGIAGWVWNSQYANTAFILTFFTAVLIAVYGLGLYFFTKQDKIQKAVGEATLLSGIFIFGLCLFLLDRFLRDIGAANQFMPGDIFGLWLLGSLPVIYLVKNRWTLSVGFGIGLSWILSYFSSTSIFGELPGVVDLKNGLNPVSWGILTVTSIAVILLYAQSQTDDLEEGGENKLYYYLMGTLSYLSFGISIFIGYISTQNAKILGYGDNFRQNIESPQSQMIASIGLIFTTLLLFGIDQYLKKALKGSYRITQLAAVSLLLAAIADVVMVRFFQADFLLAATFLELAFILWMLADFLRRDSLVAKSIFYSVGSIVTLAIAGSQVSSSNIESGFYKTFELSMVILIFIYASIIHPKNKSFRAYVWFISIIAILTRISISDQLWMLPVFIGLGIMMMGVQYMNKSKNMQSENKRILEE